MSFLEIDDFKHKWVEKFAQGINAEFLKEHVYDDGNYVWHVFSFEKMPKELYYHGNKASEEYDKIDKTGALVYSYFEEEEFSMTQEFSSSDKVFEIENSEIYVYAKDYSWCYIKTHECSKNEDYLGPYFIKL